MGPQTSNQFERFKIHDNDTDQVWDLLLGTPGVLVGTVTGDFHRGYVYTLGERQRLTDPGRAHFKELEKLDVGESEFTTFRGVRLYCDLDPDYRFKRESDTEHLVVSGDNGEPCPR